MYNVFLLSKCNLHCDYCFAEDFMGRHSEQRNAPGITFGSMSVANYARILRFLETSRISIVSLIGGEPTLHPDFLEIVKMSLAMGFSVSIKSNATWHETIQRDIELLPDEGVHFLLNVNPPSVVGVRLWQRIVSNASRLQGRHLDFQLNLGCADFNYEHILDLANKAHPRKIVWSLSSLVKGGGSDTFANPLFVRKKYSQRILSFVRAAGKQGIHTEGVHGITPCMFTKRDYRELLANQGKLTSTCNPVFDIFPDLSVIYCFPMSGFWDKKYINNYRDLQEINMEFQETLVFMRSDLYPLKACINCEYFHAEMCHGGCLAHHLEGYDKLGIADSRFFDRIPMLRSKFRLADQRAVSEARYYLSDSLSGDHYQIEPHLYMLLAGMNGQKSLGDLYRDVFTRFDKHPMARNIFRDIIIQLVKRGVLTFKPFQKMDIPMAVSSREA